jgi:penicillin-binding protein 1A
MAASLRGRPQEEFEPPPGIVKVRIDPATGLPVPEGEKGVEEPFKEGTEPRAAEEGAPPKPVEVQDIFMQ